MSLTFDQLLGEASDTAGLLVARNIPTDRPGGVLLGSDDVPLGWLLWSAVWKSEDQRTSRLDTLAEIYLTMNGEIVTVDRETLHEGSGMKRLPPLGCSVIKDDEALASWWSWATGKRAFGLRIYSSGPIEFLYGRLQTQSQRTPPPPPPPVSAPAGTSGFDIAVEPTTRRDDLIGYGAGAAAFALCVLVLLAWNPLGVDSWFRYVLYGIPAVDAAGFVWNLIADEL